MAARAEQVLPLDPGNATLFPPRTYRCVSSNARRKSLRHAWMS